MTDLAPPKYACLKWADWLDILDALDKGHRIGPSMAVQMLLQDAEVIRHQDVTSAPIFHAYAGIILSYVEVLSTIGDPDPYIESEVIQGLQAIADHFHEAALKAEKHPAKKLPD